MKHTEVIIVIVISIGIALILMRAIGKLKNEINELKTDISCMQTTLNNISRQVGIPNVITEDTKAELEKLIYEGKITEAVKSYQNITGASLMDANRYIGQLKHSME